MHACYRTGCYTTETLLFADTSRRPSKIDERFGNEESHFIETVRTITEDFEALARDNYFVSYCEC